METSYDIVIIGAGIIGAATAYQLSRKINGRILVLEKEAIPAAHQTGHNSGVIHSGLYYKPGSLKASLCVEGAATMVDFCRQHSIPVDICGKLVTATEASELPRLEELYKRGIANRVPGIRKITPEEAREIEPHVQCIGALHVPSTGITVYSRVTEKYLELFRAAGGDVIFGAAVNAIRSSNGQVRIATPKGEFIAKSVINCAGLHSDSIAHMAGADIDLQIVPFRGEYYQISAESRHLVRNLIYPVPDPRYPFLGVHFTRRITGEIEAGPNAVLALKREGYQRTSFSLKDTVGTMSFPGFWKMGRVHWRMAVEEYRRSFSKSRFHASLQRLIPELRQDQLEPGGSGVRAQALGSDGKLIDDFAFRYSPGFIHVCNVPSPAATASLVLGRSIAEKAVEHFGLAATASIPAR
jgi:(S)-2-hydroxyglutarate dehydrogenase